MPSGCYHGEGEWSTLDVAALANPPQNWQSSKKCKVPTGEGSEAQGGPNGTAMAASPLISLPADIRTLDPAWAACDSKWQYALPWDPPRALVPVSALAGPTTSAAASFIVPTAVPKPSAPDPIAALTITSSRSISSIRLVAPSTDIRSQTENPDTSSLHPHPHPHSSRPIVATRTVRASTASGHIMAASQPVPTVIPYQESTQEKVTALRPSILRVPTKPAEPETMVRSSFGKNYQQSSSGIDSPSRSIYAEATAHAPDQDFPLIMPALITADASFKGAPEQPRTITHQGRLSIFPVVQSKNPEQPISSSTSALFQPITTDANSLRHGAADTSISTLLTDTDSAIPASLIPSAAEDLGLLISMALGGHVLTSTLDPVISHPALLTDADSVVPASFTISEAYSLGPSASMAISQITLTPTHRPTSTSATSESLSFTSITYSSAPGSQISGEPTTSPGGPEAKTTALHLADDSKPTPSLASLGASSVSTLFASLASTASTTSPSHPVSNAARDLAGTRHGGVAIVVLVSMFYYLVL